MSVLVAVAAPRADELAAELEWEGVAARSLPSASPTAIVAALEPDVEAIIVPAVRAVLTPELLSACDRAGVPDAGHRQRDVVQHRRVAKALGDVMKFNHAHMMRILFSTRCRVNAIRPVRIR
mgnify:CR=1 FL=1